MTLFLYDEKHSVLRDGLDLGDLSPQEAGLAEQIVAWLDTKGVTDRYQRLRLAEACDVVPDPEFGETELLFS